MHTEALLIMPMQGNRSDFGGILQPGSLTSGAATTLSRRIFGWMVPTVLTAAFLPQFGGKPPPAFIPAGVMNWPRPRKRFSCRMLLKPGSRRTVPTPPMMRWPAILELRRTLANGGSVEDGGSGIRNMKSCRNGFATVKTTRFGRMDMLELSPSPIAPTNTWARFIGTPA